MLSVLDHTSSVDAVQEILSASNEIFEIDSTQTPLPPPADFSHWMDKLRNYSGEVVFHRSQHTNEISAFVFTYHRSIDPTQLHIWIAGCKAPFRRQGLMSKIFEFVEARAVENGIKSITVNTYPARFHHMPSFLTSRQFAIINAIREKDELGNNVEKLSYMKEFNEQYCDSKPI